QKAENVETVIDADDDGIAATGKIGAVGYGAVARAIGEGAAMQPDHDRPPGVVGETRRPDVQAQAVLALLCRVGRAKQGFEYRAPRRPVRKRPGTPGIEERVAQAGPRQRRCGWPEARRAAGRGAVGHALEGVDAGREGAA